MKTAPLKTTALLSVSNVDKKTIEDDEQVRLCNYVDVYYNDLITRDLPFMDATASVQQVASFTLRAGDTLFTKDSETSEDIAVPAFVPNSLPGVVCGYHLAVARPRAGTDGRYLYWALASKFVRQQMTVAATGVTRYGLRQDLMGRVLVPVHDFLQQRAIADFLDAETARIDSLVERRKAQSDLIEERKAATLEQLVVPVSAVGWTRTSVGRLGVDVQTGPFGSQLHADEYVSNGHPVVNPMNIVRGEIGADPEMTITDRKRSELARHILVPGDVVLARRGEMGRAGLAKADHAGWLCGTGSMRLRCSGDTLHPGFLLLVLRSRAAREFFELESVGSTMDNLSASTVQRLRCSVPAISEQREIESKAGRVATDCDRARFAFDRQVALLQERKQALITAAVTGQLDLARDIAEEAS